MDVRPSPIAGLWYPGRRDQLALMVDGLLAQAQVDPPPGVILGIVVPHAGLAYSGGVAAHAFRCLQGLRPEVVVILSPFHHPHPGAVLTSGHDAYATPLGLVPLALEMRVALDAALRERLGHGLTPVRRDREHAVEIELPFLQRVLGSFHLLPLMLRAQDEATARGVAEALNQVLAGHSALLVASSDLSHFYPQERARQLDAEILARIQALDPAGVIQAEEMGLGFACGRGAIAAVLWACLCRGAHGAAVVAYGTSGDVSGDFSAVVGYGAAVIWQVPQMEDEKEMP